MKRALSILLTVVMAVSAMAVPVFADVVEEYGVSVTFGEPLGLGVTATDKWGYKSYIKNNDYKNVSVKSLAECPKMDYVQTIEGVTFSNFIRQTTRNSKDAAGNPITVHQVFIGLNGAMRSDKGSVEFMTNPDASFNYLNACLRGATGSLTHACSDLNMYKTNTAFLKSDALYDGKNGLTYLYDIGITPYTNGERNMDGTWNEGLTWVFGRYANGEKSNGTYTFVYPIRVNQGDKATYFQVAVTDGTNYSGSRVTDPAPTAPAAPPAAVPSLKSFSDVLSSHWAHTPIMKMVAKGLFAGTSTPDANGVGTFAPDAAMTSAQFITVVTKYLYEDELAAIADRHKNSGIWYSANYELALSHGLITKAEFPPVAMDKPMNRQEMAMVLVRAADQLGQYPSQLISPLRIADYDKIDAYYKDYVQKCYSMGMICGTDNKGTFAPVATLTRAQAATVLYRLVDPASRQEIDFSVPDTQ